MPTVNRRKALSAERMPSLTRSSCQKSQAISEGRQCGGASALQICLGTFGPHSRRHARITLPSHWNHVLSRLRHLFRHASCSVGATQLLSLSACCISSVSRHRKRREEKKRDAKRDVRAGRRRCHSVSM